jgi:hypothetical protein
MTDTPPTVEVTITLSEYESLRREIEMRATLSSSLIALDLSALGVGLVAAKNSIDLYAGLGFLSVMLWLFWLDHTEQIWKLATYISLRLRPVLQRAAPQSLEWESFLRRLDEQKRVRATNYAALYITILFASVPPLLAIVLAVRAAQVPGGFDVTLGVRLASAGAVVAFWLFALGQFRQFTRSRDQMDSWISHPDTFAPTQPAPPRP